MRNRLTTLLLALALAVLFALGGSHTHPVPAGAEETPSVAGASRDAVDCPACTLSRTTTAPPESGQLLGPQAANAAPIVHADEMAPVSTRGAGYAGRAPPVRS